MIVGDPNKRKRCYYHVSFANEEWDELTSLSKQFLSGPEMLDQVAHWQSAHQQGSKGVLKFPLALCEAAFITVEVHYGES